MRYKLASRFGIWLLASAASLPSFALTVGSGQSNTFDEDNQIYFADSTAITLVDTDDGFKKYSQTVELSGDTTDAVGAGTNAWLFDVTSTTSSGTLYLSVYAEMSDNDFEAVPISQQGSASSMSACNSDHCQALSNSMFFAAKYEIGETLRIALYPKTICNMLEVTQTKGNVNGCDDTGGVAPSEEFTLKFVVNTEDSNELAEESGGDEQTIDAKFVDVEVSTGCDKSEIYFPGDGEIIVNRAALTNTASTDGSEIKKTLVLASTTLLTTQDDYMNNDVKQRDDIDDTALNVTGFLNTTDGSDNSYTVSISAVDSAGVIAGLGGCQLTGVQTSNIRGFVSENNCFIATATFQGREIWPVRVLRKFRDAWLMDFQWGRDFTFWYYSWSPAAANWLISNPLFRYPAMLALAPLILIAYAILNPVVSILFLLLLALAISFARRKRL